MAEPGKFSENALEFSEDPRDLLRKFIWVGLFCLVTILVLATYGIYRVYSWRLVESAHEEAQGICHFVLVKEKRDLLTFDSNGQARLAPLKEKQDAFRRRMQQYLEPFGVDTMRIWDKQRRIVYSTGKDDNSWIIIRSGELDRALEGQSASRLEKSFKDSGQERNLRGAADQVVSYMPVWGRDKAVLGAIEIRRNVARYRAEIRRGVIFAALLLGAVLLALFGCVFFLVKRGADRLEKAQKVLWNLATTDSLTGVYNRREVLARAYASFSDSQQDGCQERRENFGILMLDFDNFKIINDTYGHPAGDRVLKELALRIKSTLRPYDIVGRFGGEEFLVVLPDTGLQQCREIAERLRKAVREKPFVLGDLRIYGSISIGGATAHPLDKDMEAVLHRADEGLYQAKNLGKDCAAWVEDAVSAALGLQNPQTASACKTQVT